MLIYISHISSRSIMELRQNNSARKPNVSVSFCQNSARNPNNYVRNS